MPDQIELTDVEADLLRQVEALVEPGAVGVLPIPPFILALVRRYAGPPLLAEVARHIIREEVTQHGGATLPVGHAVKLTDLKARGGKWSVVAILEGPAA